MKDIDLREIKLNDLPLALQIFIIAAACATVLYFGYMLDITSLKRQLVSIQGNEQDLKVQFESLIASLNTMNDDVSQLPQLESMLQTWQGKLIKRAELPDLINDILKIGTANELQIDGFNPGVESKEGPYFKVPIKAVVLGNYHQIANFMSQVANLPSIVLINDFTISNATATDMKTTGQPAADQLKAELNLSIYYLPEK